MNQGLSCSPGCLEHLAKYGLERLIFLPPFPKWITGVHHHTQSIQSWGTGPKHCSLVKSTTWGIPPASLFCSSMPEFGEFIIHLNFPDTNHQSHEHCTYPNSTTLITDFSKGINQDCPGEPMRKLETHNPGRKCGSLKSRPATVLKRCLTLPYTKRATKSMSSF